MLAVVLFANLPREWARIAAALVVAGVGAAIILRHMGKAASERVVTIREDSAADTIEAPSNNEMKQTKPAMARMARSSLLISVFDGRLKETTGGRMP